MLTKLTDKEIAEILERNIIGRLGFHDKQSSYIVPISYVYENGAVLCHSFEGQKTALMRAHPQVCFEVDEISDYSNWVCVIATGTFTELTSDKEIAHLRTFFSDEMLNSKIGEIALPPESHHAERSADAYHSRVSVYYKIVFSSVTGRRERSSY